MRARARVSLRASLIFISKNFFNKKVARSRPLFLSFAPSLARRSPSLSYLVYSGGLSYRQVYILHKRARRDGGGGSEGGSAGQLYRTAAH